MENYDVNTQPHSNLGYAIAALALFFPLGIPAIIRATKVNRTWAAGDKERAWQLSLSARRLGRTGMIIGIVFYAIYMVACFAIGFASAFH